MSLKHLADELAARGRYGDTELVHMTKGEVAGLQSLAEAAGGSLTTNPDTGKPEAFFLAALLPTILGGVGASMGLGALGTAALGAGVGALTNKRNPLMGAIMGGMGGMGGGQLAGALQGAGAAAGAGQQAAMQNVANQTASTMASGVDPGLVNALRPQMVADATTAAANQFAAQPFTAQLSQGVRALGSEAGRTGAMQALGGAKGALKAGAMAAAPMLYESMMPRPMGALAEDDTELPRYDYTAGLTGDYYGVGGDGSTRERQFFTQPTFTRRAAQGGIMQLAEGGNTDPKDPAQGMTGASAEGMRYLMGQTNTSPATQMQQAAIAKMAEARNMATQQQAPAVQPQKRMTGLDLLMNPQSMAALALGRISSGGVSGGGNFKTRGTSSIGSASAAPMAPPPPGSDRQFVYDSATHSVVRNPGYIDPEAFRQAQFSRQNQAFGSSGNDSSAAAGGEIHGSGIASLAKGGMQSGGFVIPADVVSMVGEGNTEAGYKDIARAIPGATAIRGKDGGQADTVKTSIEGKQPARVAHGEMYVPPAAVKRAGGAKKLYAMMDKVRKQAKGDTKQIKPVDLRKALA